MMGRPRKPLASLKLSGSFRRDRHGDRSEGDFEPGVPTMPAGLTGTAAWLWQLVVDEFPQHGLNELDAPMLEALTDWWIVYQSAMVDAKQGDYRACMMAAVAFKQVTTIGAAFGLSPVARAALKLPAATPPAPEPLGKGRFFNGSVVASRDRKIWTGGDSA